MSADHPPSTGAESRTARRRVRGLAAAAVMLSLLALLTGAAAGPHPASAGDWIILFIHVPAAWLSLALYAVAVAAAADALSGQPRLPLSTLEAIAPLGAAAAFVALWTGLTSQQARGDWWGWDARLVCELVLLLLFLALVALHAVTPEPLRAARASAVLVLVGALNIPIIYVSVDWWHSLHERAAATVGRSPSALAAMAVMTMAFCLYAAAVVLARLEAVARERGGVRSFETVRTSGGNAPVPAKEQQ